MKKDVCAINLQFLFYLWPTGMGKIKNKKLPFSTPNNVKHLIVLGK